MVIAVGLSPFRALQTGSPQNKSSSDQIPRAMTFMLAPADSEHSTKSSQTAACNYSANHVLDKVHPRLGERLCSCAASCAFLFVIGGQRSGAWARPTSVDAVSVCDAAGKQQELHGFMAVLKINQSVVCVCVCERETERGGFTSLWRCSHLCRRNCACLCSAFERGLGNYAGKKLL